MKYTCGLRARYTVHYENVGVTHEDRHMHRGQLVWFVRIYITHLFIQFLHICASHAPCVCVCVHTCNVFATACALERTGVLDTTGMLLCINFTSLSDALTSGVVILTAVWASAGWQIEIKDCLWYLDTKIELNPRLWNWSSAHPRIRRGTMKANAA